MPTVDGVRARPLRIAYVPFHNVGNAYVARMHEVLSRFGPVQQFVRPRQWLRALLAGRFQRYDLAIFNWSENDIVDPRTHRISWRGTAKVLLKTGFARAVSRRLVFVRHNLYPHATHAEHEALARRMLAWYERMFDLVFIHSGAHLDGRRRYCPHPLYRNTLDAGQGAAPAMLHDVPADYFVMFGRVAAYKKILELARVFPADRNLLIIGSVDDADYGQQLAQLGRPNVFYRPGFLSEEAAQRVVVQSRAIVLAHAGDNTVVSGSFFYALSILVPVLAVETPFLRWVAPRVGDALLVLATDLAGLAEAAQRFERSADLSLLQPRLQLEFGDQAIAEALAPALVAR